MQMAMEPTTILVCLTVLNDAKLCNITALQKRSNIMATSNTVQHKTAISSNQGYSMYFANRTFQKFPGHHKRI